MKITLTAILLLITMNVIAQKSYDISNDPKNGELTFRGPVTFDDLKNEPSFAWLRAGAEEYSPDQKLLQILKERLPKYKMVVFLGTWCDDSHYLIPKLEKILELTNYPMHDLTMFGVDREKTTKGGEEKKYNVTLVPTVILYSADGKEAGRITETVQKSVEADLLAILGQ